MSISGLIAKLTDLNARREKIIVCNLLNEKTYESIAKYGVLSLHVLTACLHVNQSYSFHLFFKQCNVLLWSNQATST